MNTTGIFKNALLVLVVVGTFLIACRKDTYLWKPDVLFIMKPDSGLTTQTFDFRIDLLNLPPTQQEFYIRWDLNGDSLWDSDFSVYPVNTHRFYQKGIYPVKAEILTEDGQMITLTRMVSVDQGYSAPHAAFTIDPPESNYLTGFTFDAGITFDDEDPFSSLLFRWDFESDGIWDTESSRDPIAQHKYKKAGNFSVKLSVTDPTRRIATETKILVVNMHDEWIHPDFIWSSENGTVKDTFLLDASATHHETDPSRILMYTWDIGNEVTYGPFTDPVFKHVFWFSGMESVTLTVTDQFGLSNRITREFFVIKENKPPGPVIFVPTHYGNITTNFYFSSWPSTDDVTPPSGLLVRWDFEGDGIWDTGWSYEKTIFHQFSEPGNFGVILEAEDEGGERAKTVTQVSVSRYTAQTGYIQDKRDEKFYGIVKIGNQWWMSDNLDFRTMPKMDFPLPQECYSQNPGNCDLYGALYRGLSTISYNSEVLNLCPDGWRIPDKQDWMTLKENLPASNEREAMMVGGSLGFNARFTGYGSFNYIYDVWGNIVGHSYDFEALGEEARFLSLTTRPGAYESQSLFYMGLQKDFAGVDFLWGNLKGMFSIRCIKSN